MKLESLNKTTTRSKKRLGRGIGSGRGKTSGRGTKGQKARGKVRIGFVGGGLPLYRKLPLKRGKGNKPRQAKKKGVSLSELNILKVGAVVDLELLLKENIISREDVKKGVKLLADGEVEKAFTIKLPLSKTAQAKIEKAGGTISNA